MRLTTINFEMLTAGAIISLIAFILLVAVIALSILIYRRDARGLSSRLRTILWSLRGFAWLIVLILFFEPRLEQERVVDRPSRVVIAIDNSLSMSLPATDSPSSSPVSRWEATRESLSKGMILDDLSKTHEVKLYSVGRDTTLAGAPPTALSGVSSDYWLSFMPTADETRLGDSLTTILRENRTSPVSGIVLFSDGQSNSGSNIDGVIRTATSAKIPIHAIGLGTEQSPINLRIADLRVPSKVFKGDDLRGRALLQSTGLPARRVPIEIFVEPTDKSIAPVKIESRDVDLSSDGTPVPIEFQHLPQVEGSWQLIVKSPAIPGEIRVEDNHAVAPFEVIDQTTKVLLMAGGPTREYRFLRNLLFRDASMSLSVLLQSASSNSSQEADRAIASLPTKKEEFFEFDVIIAIDVDWSAVTNESQQLLEEWVSRQAGGLIVMAGPVNTPKLASDSTPPITDLFPVVLKEILQSEIDAGHFTEAWPISFTRDGELASFLQLDDDATRSKERWQQFAGLFWCYPRVALKPAAITLATFNDPREQTSSGGIPLIVTQFFGSGRVLYLGSGEFWRLRQFGEEIYDRLWIRTIREMGQSRLLRGSSRVQILVDGDRFRLGSDLQIRVQAMGNDYRPISAKTIPMTVIDAAGNKSGLEMKAVPNQPGIYDATLPLRNTGEYRLQVLAPESTELVERRITIDIPEREFAEPRMNRQLLERITQETGGQFLRVNQLDQLPKLLPDVSEQTIIPGTPYSLWDNAWILSLLVIILATEWILRKRAYLA